MEQPFHSVRAAQTNRLTPQKAFGLAAAVALQAGFVWVLVSGLAATLIQKLPEELKVAVEQEKIQPKPPPPPPPQVDLPPPPVAPPPDIVIQTEVPTTNAITVTNKPPPPQQVHKTVVSPVSIGRPHVCTQNYPDISVRLNEEGTTLLSFHVMPDGSVSGAAVAKSSGYPRLDEAALSCASRWHYKPQTEDGQPMETPWQANVQWKLH